MESLKHGKYEFVLSDDDSLAIRIKFTISENGSISYDKPEF